MIMTVTYLVLMLLTLCNGKSVTLHSEDQEDALVFQLASDILKQKELSCCSLVLSVGDGNKCASQSLSRLLIQQSLAYSTYVSLCNVGQNVFRPKPWNEYIGITGHDQIYSFTTMPPDMMSQVQPGGTCVLHVLVSDTPTTFPEQLIQVAGTVQVRNLDDFFLLHFRHLSDEMKLMDHPAKGIRYKLISSYNQDETIKLQTVCFFCHEGRPVVRNLGTFPVQQVTQEMYTHQYEISNEPAAIKFVHFETVDTDVSRKNKALLGKEYLSSTESLFLEMENAMKVKYEVIINTDFTEDAIDIMRPNGSWTGAVGYILSGEADAGTISILSGLHVRQVAIPTQPTVFLFAFVTAVPNDVIPLDILFLPFTPRLWLALSVTWFISGVVLWRLIRASGGSTTLGSVTSSIFKMLIDQQYDLPPLATSRKFEGVLMLMSIIISCAYVTKLLAVLSVLPKENLPNTMDQLDQEGFECLMSIYSKILVSQVANNQIHMKMINQSSSLPNTESCMEQVIGKEKRACLAFNFFIERNIQSYLDHMGRHTLRVAPEKSYDLYTTFGFDKSNVLSPKIFRYHKRIQESGLVAQWIRVESFHKYWLNRRQLSFERKSVVDDAGPSSGVRGENILVVVGFWAIGMAVALVTFVLEMTKMLKSAAVQQDSDEKPASDCSNEENSEIFVISQEDDEKQ